MIWVDVGLSVVLLSVSAWVLRQLRVLRRDVKGLGRSARSDTSHPTPTVVRLEACKLLRSECDREQARLRKALTLYREIEEKTPKEELWKLRTVLNRSSLLPDALPSEFLLPSEAAEEALAILRALRSKCHGTETEGRAGAGDDA